MNKEAQRILAAINAKKAEIKNLVAQHKTKEAKDAKAELNALQEEFDLVKDLDDAGAAGAAGAAATGNANVVNNNLTMKDKVTAFVNVMVAGVRHTQAAENDVRIYNAMNEADPGTDGGLTVPQDIRTQIKELRRSQDNLEDYVNVEGVTTLTGSRVIEKDAEATPWDEVEEESVFGEAATPQFKPIKYKVTKKGGILKLTEELLRDTAENIMGYLKKYIAKKTKATRNAYILRCIKEMTTAAGEPVAIETIDSFKDIFNTMLDPAVANSACVFTNQNGFNYMDKLKDSDGNYILQPDPTKKTEKLLFGAYPVVKLLNKTLPDEETVGGVKHPVICGDLKEAITLFDREYMSIEISNQAGDLWNKDQTGVKVRDRFDVQPVDAGAVKFGYITEANQG